MADHGGLRAAYRAYLNAPETEVDLKPLPDLNFTHRQLFFISYAQVMGFDNLTSVLL